VNNSSDNAPAELIQHTSNQCHSF